jgi:TonB family protein
MRATRPWAAALCALPLAAGAAEPAPPPAQAEAPPAPPRQLQVYQKVMPRFDGRLADGGCVTVKFQIRHDGFVGDVEVLESKPAALAEPAIAAMKQWQFQSFPATERPVYATQTFHFTPEPVRMPDEAIRGPFAALGEGGALNSAGCGALRPRLPAVTEAPKK